MIRNYYCYIKKITIYIMTKLTKFRELVINVENVSKIKNKYKNKSSLKTN